MSHTITIRLTKEQANWLEERVRETGMPAGRIIREQLEAARGRRGQGRFLRMAGQIAGPRELSSRKGFSNP